MKHKKEKEELDLHLPATSGATLILELSTNDVASFFFILRQLSLLRCF
jgi:hypothetical protein